MKKQYTVGGEKVEVDVSLSTTCRCGQRVEIGMVDHLPGQPSVAGGIPMAMHEEPRCAIYEKLDLLDYMRWLRTGVEHIN